ncbi:MAG: bifunctional DNA primase/polymerase, partial [Marinosulfonomonas sp.]|nr:bifunctional DNA primase/polymerase [Marinosulfonomonas sp.]
MVDTNINVDALAQYSDLCTLMPSHRWDATHVNDSGDTIEDGKRPLYKNWTTRPFKSAQTLKQAKVDDRNVGVRLRADQLIVDVDPRNMPEGRDTFK